MAQLVEQLRREFADLVIVLDQQNPAGAAALEALALLADRFFPDSAALRQQ